jgi:hypothetical protein
VSTAGAAGNDGLSTSQAMSTFQVAFDALKNYGPILGGNWSIIASAGTYSFSSVQSLSGVKSVNRVVIRGPAAGHPNVPTCIINGTSSVANYSHGMSISDAGLLVTVQDIKFQTFTGDPLGNTRGALVFDNGCDAYANNIHVVSCTWFGVYYSRGAAGRHQGGIIDACRQGVLTDGSKCTVGYNATSLATGTVVKNCTEVGVYWSRNTDGHTDYVTFEDNVNVGLYVAENSRTDSVGCTFKRNYAAVRATNAGWFGNNPTVPCNFNIGTADANTTDIEYKAYGGDVEENTSGSTELRIAFDRTLRTVTGTAPTTLATPYTIPANRLQGVGKSCRVEIYGVYTVTAGSTVTVEFGGMVLALTVPGAVTGATFHFSAVLNEVQGGYRGFSSLSQNLTAPRTGSSGAGFVNSSAQTISIKCTLAGAGDTISIYRTDVFLMG